MRTRLILVLALSALVAGGEGLCMAGCLSEASPGEAVAATADAMPCHSTPAQAPADGEEDHGDCLHCAASLVAFSAAGAGLADVAPPAALRLAPHHGLSAPRGPAPRVALHPTGPPPPDLRLLESSLLL